MAVAGSTEFHGIEDSEQKRSLGFSSQNRSKIFCKFTEIGETYPEITEKFQNQIKTTKNHREKEREKEKNVPGKLKRE